MRGALFLLLLSLSTSLFSQTLVIPKHYFAVDTSNKIILAQTGFLSDFEITQFESLELEGKTSYRFDSPQTLSLNQSYEILFAQESYTLYFTSLALIQMQVYDEIVDDPKIPADFVYAEGKKVIESIVGIEIRGGVSKYYKKKTYDLEFWTGPGGTENKSVQMGNLRFDDDWILDGIYNEPLRIRSSISHKLWLQIHEPYYLEHRPNAKAGADVNFVEVFLNGEYQGLYNLSEQVDHELLQLNEGLESDHSLLYKASNWADGTRFYGVSEIDSAYYWSGFEVKYPTEPDMSTTKVIYDFVDFVVNASDEDFENQIWDYIDKQNAVDYFLYLNIINGMDNTGKNIYLARPDVNTKFFIAPWDLDGVFGTNYQGKDFDDYYWILSNGLFGRLIDADEELFMDALRKQWHEMRKEVYTTNYLYGLFTSKYQELSDKLLYEREHVLYGHDEFKYEDLLKVEVYLNNKIGFLDEFFTYDPEEVFPETEEEESTDFGLGISLAMAGNLSIYPNPSEGMVYVNSDAKKYAVYNSQGEMLLQGDLSRREGQIDCTHFPSGLYFFKVGEIVERVFIQ